MRWVWPLACLGALACASQPPPPVVKPLYKDGVLQRALTVEEAERYLRQTAPEFEACYRREALNMAQQVSSYVMQVSVPTDGKPATVTVLKETVPGQMTLRGCLVDAIRRVKFPAHIGQVIKMNVPIEAT